MSKKYSRQQIQKLFHNQCLVCGEEQYEVLDAHRIVEQGPYIASNIIVLCCNCHRRTHTGEIRFDRKYLSSKGTVVHWFNGDEEMWTEVKN